MKSAFHCCLVFLVAIVCVRPAQADSVKCQKAAEALAISESKKKGNLPDYLLSISHPTEMDGNDVVVYIGAHANYNYFKFSVDKTCRSIKIEEAEYAN